MQPSLKQYESSDLALPGAFCVGGAAAGQVLGHAGLAELTQVCQDVWDLPKNKGKFSDKGIKALGTFMSPALYLCSTLAAVSEARAYVKQALHRGRPHPGVVVISAQHKPSPATAAVTTTTATTTGDCSTSSDGSDDEGAEHCGAAAVRVDSHTFTPDGRHAIHSVTHLCQDGRRHTANTFSHRTNSHLLL